MKDKKVIDRKSVSRLIESNRLELKRILNDSLEKEVVSFLNYHEGGEIFIGIDDDGTVVGVQDSDDIQKRIIDRIKNNIYPSTMGLFDVVIVTLKEAVINAIIHNDYSNGIPPVFEIFADRIVITSAGGLPQELSQEEFF